MSETTNIYDVDRMTGEQCKDALFELVNVVKYFGADDADVKSDIARILDNHARQIERNINGYTA